MKLQKILITAAPLLIIILVGCKTNAPKSQQADVNQPAVNPLEVICDNSQEDLSITNCNNGEYFRTQPTGYETKEEYIEFQAKHLIKFMSHVSDGIYDSNGKFLMWCGGARDYSLREERECSKYYDERSKCTIVKKTCFE